MNSAIGPNFKVILTEKSTYKSHKQCTGPTKKHTGQHKCKRWGKNAISKLTLHVVQANSVSLF